MAFLVLTSAGGDVLEALEIAVDGVSDLSPLWRGLDEPFVELNRRRYQTHGFGQWPWYDGEPRYLAAKSEMFGRDLSFDDLCRWDDAGAGDVRTWSTDEVLAPSLLDAGDAEFWHDWDRNVCELGTLVPWARDVHEGGTGPDFSGNEPSPPRSLTDTDEEFIEAVRIAVGDFAATATAFDRVRAGLSQADILDRVFGVQ